ncbi:CotH kinase family protein [candidate division KSB1 bacterium]|nr:CotH kinase family protein [candidate division KSB1 bacterium]
MFLVVIILGIFMLFGSSVLNAQEIDHWESVVLASDTWKYFVGTSEPPATWRSGTFDDTSWREGQGGFGYGDDDDQTVLANILSLYLRSRFDIADISTIGEVIFHIDYDDAFIAYLNDVEIARSAGVSGMYPSHNTSSTQDHEAQMYQGGSPDAFYVEPGHLQRGSNVLALQIHNTSTTSSDMSAIPFLSIGLTTTERRYRPTPEWFQEPFEFTSSNIPIIIINTQGQQIQNEPKIMARMGVIDNQNGINSIQDNFNEYDGWIGIEMRGNATQSGGVVQDKWSYSLETRNEDGSNNNVKLLGMPKDNDWILLAVFIDKTLARDALAYRMARSLGRWAPRTRHVELVINGEYQGVYLFMEKIKPDNNRVDIAKLDSADIAGEAVTGGYIWDIQQADGTDIDFGQRRVLKYPKPDQVMPQQLDYIRNYDDEFRAVMNRSYYDDPVRGYPKYIDVTSFIDEIILQEITKNSDAYGWSGFFYKERSGKMFAGPIWDFDQALSNSTHMQGDRIQMWVIENNDGSHPPFWEKLWETPAFKQQLADTWFEYRRGPLETNFLFGIIDSLATYLNEAQQRNFTKWAILGVPIWRSTAGAAQRNTYQKEVDYMKDYLREHADWMDAELAEFTSVDCAQDEQGYTRLTINIFPNPVQSDATFSYTLDRSGQANIRIYNILGQHVRLLVNAQQLQGQYAIKWDGRDSSGQMLAHGIYFYELRVDGLQMARSKFVKF